MEGVMGMGRVEQMEEITWILTQSRTWRLGVPGKMPLVAIPEKKAKRAERVERTGQERKCESEILLP